MATAKVRRTWELPQEMDADLKQVARREGRSVTQQMLWIVQQFLDWDKAQQLRQAKGE